MVIMQPGPIHLFWTTGIFYLWSLKDRFDFVLIVSDDYRNNPQFAKVTGLPSIRHVEFLPQRGGVLRHFSFNKITIALLKDYPPSYILLHNLCYVDNQYLIYWASKLYPKTKRYNYQSGRMSLLWLDDFKARRAVQIEKLTQRFPILGNLPSLSGQLIDVRNSIAYFLNYKFLPLLTTNSVFNPPINVTNGMVNCKPTRRRLNTHNDYFFSYLEYEIEAYHALGFENIIKVQHPLSSCSREVFEYLYGKVEEADVILLLPSYGYTSRMLQQGWTEKSLVKHLADKWCNSIERLLERFPNYALKIKLHPHSSEDPLWKKIIEVIWGRFPSTEIIPPKLSAEWYVVQSKVIVGDVSTVLWWAGLLGNKVVISLDVFGYPGGGEMESYSPLVTTIKELSSSVIGKMPRTVGDGPTFGADPYVYEILD
jgi:hypothetical protein